MTVMDFERGARNPHANNLSAIRTALEAKGIRFTLDNQGALCIALMRSFQSEDEAKVVVGVIQARTDQAIRDAETRKKYADRAQEKAGLSED